MRFRDKAHEEFFAESLRADDSPTVPGKQAMFYILGLHSVTRFHIWDIYDFTEKTFKPDCIYAPWQTKGTQKLTQLALNLGFGYSGDLTAAVEYTPQQLFCCSLMPYMLEAVKLRYPEYEGWE